MFSKKEEGSIQSLPNTEADIVMTSAPMVTVSAPEASPQQQGDDGGGDALQLQDIDQHDATQEKSNESSSPGKGRQNKQPKSPKQKQTPSQSTVATVSDAKLENPCSIAQRRFFSSDKLFISRTKNVVIQGQTEGPHYRSLPDMAAHIPPQTSAFRLVGNFNNYRPGHYTVRWKVKTLQDFNIPDGLRFVVNVSYDLEPDISGTLDVIMPPHKLSILGRDRWYNLVLEEKLVIQPHAGIARIQAVLCNNEHEGQGEFTGFAIEHVEISPMSLNAESRNGTSDVVVPRAAVPNFTLNLGKQRLRPQNSSDIASSAPVTRLAASKSSRFMASLAQSQNVAFITVWDMTIVKNPSSAARNLSKMYKSCARGVIEYPGIGDLPIGLSLSTNGDQVVVCQEPRIGDWADGSDVEKATFPFKIFSNPLVPQASLILNMDPPSTNDINEKSDNANSSGTAGNVRNDSYNNADAQESSSEPMELQEVLWEHDILRTFVGYGQFLPETRKSDWEKKDVNSGLTSSNAEADDDDGGDDSKEAGAKSSSSQQQPSSMFVACNGLYLDVFEISSEKKWKRMHTITLSKLIPTLSRRITCKMMMESISNNTFMWLEDGGRSCTIWNLLTGSNITHISSIENARFKGPTFRGHSKMAISPHESIVALASVDGSLTTYFANTGMAIDDRKFPGYKIEHVGFHAQDDQLLVILRSSRTYELSAKILDTLQLKSEIDANKVPIPTIGSTILAFFYSRGLWNRGIICEADGTNINCYISHQPASSKVAKSGESVFKARSGDTTYESMLPGEESIRYSLRSAYHRELLPEGDGVSYWVLRVEVVEEDLKYNTQRLIFSFVPEPWMRVTTSEVWPDNLQSVFFLPGGLRFAVVGMQTLQIWNLPTRENRKCSLQCIWSQPREDKDLEPGGIAYKSGRVRDYYLDTTSTVIYMDMSNGNTVAEIKMNDKSRKKMISLPGPRTVGARYAILYCFRSIHLLAAAYAFSNRESKKSTRDGSLVSLTYEDHAEAILRFTREHINRMMSIKVYSPRKRGGFSAPRDSNSTQTKNTLGRDHSNRNAEEREIVPREHNDRDNSNLPLEEIHPLRDGNNKSFGSMPGVVVGGDNVTIHGNANKHDDDDTDDRVRHIILVKDTSLDNKRVASGNNSKPADVVTVLTLLLDHPYLQGTNHIFVEGLLNSGNGDWIPRDNKSLNPIKRAIEARNGQLVEAFIEYCIKNAKKYHPAYLMPAVQCLNELSDRYPILLADMFRKASYVPVHNHAYVSSHAVIANPQYGSQLMWNLKFWNRFMGRKWEKSNAINDYEKPVFSLRSQLPFRASSFMNILNIETSYREVRVEKFPTKPDVVAEETKRMQSQFSHNIYVSPFPKLSMYGPYRPWFQDATESAKSAFTDIAGQDFFDSPAMVATLEYKWHKFGLFYWLVRFIVVFTFFVLVVVITAKQISTSSLKNNAPQTQEQIKLRYMEDWRHVIEVTIGFGCLLIAYELIQCLDAPRKYISSPYNYMDIAAYVTPVIGCILFLRADYSNMDNDHGPDQIWVMSFAILALYMNILFELRVIKQLGIVVNIILNITRRIVWFFLIFGLFLVSFTHALLHLLHTRPQQPECLSGTCDDTDYPDGYPTGFFAALSATYFFLAGRYDPVSKSFDDGSTGFHIMMVIFFFFTAILLLNILIALMNDAFNESKDQGQLAWLKQWSEVIAEVEVYLMTQGARQNRNYFPDYIYYGANEQQAELYESKYYIANKSNLSIENRFLVDTVSLEQNATQLGQRALIRDVQTLSKEIDRLKQTQSGFNQDMTKLTELMAAFLAHTTTVSYSDSELMSPASPVEQDPPVSGTSPTSVPEASTPTGAVSAPPTTPKALAFPGGAMRASAAVQPRTSSTTIQQPLPPPGAMRRKVSATAPDTESPIADSPTKHFNTPQSSIDDVGVPIPLTGHGQSTEQLPGGMASDDYASAPRPPLRPPPPLPVVVSAGKLSSSASPSSSTHGAASPYKVGDIPDFSRHVSGDKGASQPSLRRRLQQNLTAVHTVDDALKSQHQQLQENNASHPMYVNLGAEEEKVEVSTMVPAHHSAYYSTSSSSSSTSWQVQQQQQSSQAYQYQGPHAPLELPDNPRRTQSDIVAPTIPRVDVPMHTVHVARPSASSSHPSEEVLLDEEQDEL